MLLPKLKFFRGFGSNKRIFVTFACGLPLQGSFGDKCLSRKNMLIGREKEKQILIDALHSEYSQFIAVYGRRRVGKTFLI